MTDPRYRSLTPEDLAAKRLPQDDCAAKYQNSKKANGKAQEQAPAGEGVTIDDFRAYMPTHTYIFMPSREPWPASSVNARLRRCPSSTPTASPCSTPKASPS